MGDVELVKVLNQFAAELGTPKTEPPRLRQEVCLSSYRTMALMSEMLIYSSRQSYATLSNGLIGRFVVRVRDI